MSEQDYVSRILAEGEKLEKLEKEAAARRQKLEEELRALGLTDEEY